MKKILSFFLSLSVFAAALPYIAASADTTSDEEVTVIVELSGDPVLSADDAKEMGASEYNETQEAQDAAEDLSEKQDEVMEKILDIYPDAEKGFSYTHTLNGFSVTVLESDIAKIRGISGVKSVTKSQTYQYTEPDDNDEVSIMSSDETETLVCCDEIGADYMHDAGYSGEGQVVAIIDSEFDVNHEMFSGDISDPKYSKSDIKELLSNTTLNITADANRVWRSEKIPFAYNYADKNAEVYNYSNGEVHGTHVAGIVAGNYGTEPDGDKFESVASEAQLILMKVTAKKTGRMSSEAIIAAIDDAAKLGVDAINLSLGCDDGFASKLEKLVNTAAEAGIIVSVSSQNGDRGYDENYIYPENMDYSTSYSPAHANYVTSVASSNSKKVWTDCYTMTTAGGDSIAFFNGTTNALFSDSFSDKQYEYVYCKDGSDEDYTGIDVTGKIALVERGGVFTDIISAAIDHGAIGMIIINNTTRDFTQLSLAIKDIPVCLVQNSDGSTLRNAENKSIQTSTDVESVLADYAYVGMSYYTSWGTTYDLNLKPEITTPGGNIYSSIPNDEYTNMSGTSMAAPHLTGAAALMYQYIDKNYSDKYEGIGKRAFAENLMMSSAAIVYADAENGIAESPRRQGAGLLSLEDAVTTPVYLVGENADGKSKINLGELGENRTFTLKFTAKNFTADAVTYDDISFLCQTDGTQEVDGTTYIGDTIKLAASSTDIPTSVTVSANGETEVSFDVTLDEEQVTENLETYTNGFWVDGFVILKSSTDGVPEISIPYTGFYGDWTKAPIWDEPYYSDNAITGNTVIKDENGKYILGQNQIAIKSGVYTDEQLKEYADEDYAGVSPNCDDVFDNINICTFALRAVLDISADIYSVKDGKIDENVYSCTDDDDLMTAYMLTTAEEKPNNLYGLDDGDYRVVVSGKLACGDVEKESVEMNFYIDTEKPKVLSRSIDTDDDGKTMLNMTLSDNRYLMGVIVKGVNESGTSETIYEPIKALKETDVSVDVTGLSEVTATIYDYALNSLAVYEDERITITPTGRVTGTNASFSIETDVYNYSGEEQSAALTAAVYDEDGVLKGISTINEDALPVGVTTYSFTIKLIYNPDYNVKFFAWDSLDGMKPFGECSSYKLSDIVNSAG